MNPCDKTNTMKDPQEPLNDHDCKAIKVRCNFLVTSPFKGPKGPTKQPISY